jgi:zinc protease
VNRAVRQHLKTDLMRIVIVTKNAQVFRDAVVTNEPSPIAYNSPKPAALMDEDKVIQAYRLNVRPEDVIVVPVERVFE